MTIEGRRTGWLDDGMHFQVRETLLHTAARYGLLCPVYCLMPDHAHVLLMGVAADSDQRVAMKFFRRHWNGALRAKGVALQKQGFDHVLDESERNPDAFEDTCSYVLHNPERALLVSDWRDWSWLGSLVPGYPDLNPRDGNWRERFWTIHSQERGRRM
jgi:REP element-mobilizing transposase RayT